jgi:hypothetical protein
MFCDGVEAGNDERGVFFGVWAIDKARGKERELTLFAQFYTTYSSLYAIVPINCHRYGIQLTRLALDWTMTSLFESCPSAAIHSKRMSQSVKTCLLFFACL